MFLVALLAGSSAAQTDPVPAFHKHLSSLCKEADGTMQSVVAGKDGWLFFVPELRSLSAGRFWGIEAAKVSRATNPKFADPVPAIVGFHEELKAAEIELLVVPVPAKAAIYAESLADGVRPNAKGELPRMDSHQAEFYKLLKDRGVTVVDLWPEYVTHRADRDGPVFCRTDSHWSGAGARLAAAAIAKHVRDREWLKAIPRREYVRSKVPREITGDLARLLDEKSPVRESLTLDSVQEKSASALKPVEDWRESPVLLLGDSHTLVFHDPDLFGGGAGLPEQLAAELGFPVDLIGVRGSGATAARISLVRRGDQLKGKQLVIWCFASREFTESPDGWRVLPVIRKPK